MRHHLHNGPRHRRRVGFRVLAARDDRVEEFAAGAQLHDEVHVVPVLERARDGHNLVAPFEVVHDLHLAADVGVFVFVNIRGGTMVVEIDAAAAAAATLSVVRHGRK